MCNGDRINKDGREYVIEIRNGLSSCLQDDNAVEICVGHFGIVSLPVTFLTSPRRLHCMLNADGVRFVGEMGTL